MHDRQRAINSRIDSPPVANIIPKTLVQHGHARVDNYFWLNERDNQDVLDYLREENQYADGVMAHQKTLEETLFEEIKGRFKQADLSVPYKLDDYFYYTRVMKRGRNIRSIVANAKH